MPLSVPTKSRAGHHTGPAKYTLLSERDRTLIDEFVESIGTISEGRRRKYHLYLGKIGHDMNKPFEVITRPDLIAYLNAISTMDFSDDTKREYRMISKKFFRWLHNAEFVEGIKLGTVDGVVQPDDLLTEAELTSLRGAAKGNLRNQALLETIQELGPRPQEFLILRKCDVLFDEYGAKVTIRKGKTGGRTVRLIESAPILASWIENHPLPARDAPLWVDNVHNEAHHALKWAGLLWVMESLRRNAGIEKRFTAYTFRHTRATKLAKVLTEAQLCSVMGWRIGSIMPRRYIHFSGRDVDDALLKASGLKKPEEVRELRAPRKCVRCSVSNPPDAETCAKCGMALSLTAAMKKDEESRKMEARLKLVEEWMDLKRREDELSSASA